MKPIKTALLSYGMSGEVFHAPLLHVLPDFTLDAVVQRTSDRVRQHYPEVRVMRSADHVFEDSSIELVIVNTPNDTHFDYASKALKAGKHVVVEKPFTVTRRDADKLIELAAIHNKQLTVFQNRRWDGDFLTVKKVLAEKLLGKVVEFEAHYDRFRNYIEPNTWKEESKPGTGIVYNLGSHMLDQIVELFGMPLMVDARIGIQRPGGRVDDFYDIRLEYDGLLVIVKSSYLVKATMPRYIIHGVNGSFVKFGIDSQEQALKDKQTPGSTGWGKEHEQWWGTLTVESNGSTVEKKIETVAGNYLTFYQGLYRAIREGEKPAVTAEQARDVIHLIELSYRSNAEKRAVRVSAG